MASLRKRFVTLALLCGCLAGPAQAWKPTTHESLAEVVLQDLLDDGRLSFFLVDQASGEVRQKIGEFPADPELLESVRTYPAYFRAGVLGPDAYPDIATGQCIVHPDESKGGSNAWLEFLFSQAKSLPPGEYRKKCIAWTTGFLVHAAGDMYAHDYINSYSGGDFSLGKNAIKHVILEGHIAGKTPNNFAYDASIAGIEGFIYDNMINAVDGNELREHLLVGPEAQKSIPAQFSDLRRRLQANIGDYYVTKDSFKKYAAALAKNPLWPAEITYKEHWRDDIIEGLKAWPATSHEVALALFFNTGGTNVEKAQQILDRYAKDHLLSMIGAPDAAGKFLNVADAVASAVLPQEALARLRRWRNNLLLELLQSGTGIDLREYKTYMTQPDSHFDEVLGPTSRGSGRKISMHDFDQYELRLSGNYFDYQRFRPAYNTVVMTRLIFLSPESVNGLINSLTPNSPVRLSKGNALLGFQRKLDGSAQWNANPEKMVLAQDPQLYPKLFFDRF